jgi:negative regulator of sigma E activity
MSDRILEQVSALADDELQEAEARLLLARMARDTELREAAARYAVIGEALRGSLPAQRRDFSAGVMAAIADDGAAQEYPVESPRLAGSIATRLADVARPFAGAAVAATVAMLAIVMLQNPAGSPGDGADFATDLADAPIEVVPAASGSASNPIVSGRQVEFSNVRSPELQNQLRSYLMNHNEHAGNARLRGVMPYVQIAADGSALVAEDAEATPENGGALPNDPQF